MSTKRPARPKKAARKKVAQKVSPKTRTPAPPERLTAASDLEELIRLLRDPNKRIKLRLDALQKLGAARFASPEFPSVQDEYIGALREAAEDPDHEMRQRALGILAREKDPFAQHKLVAGLKDPQNALLPPEKALQLLSYDIHSDAYPVARAIVRNPPNELAKREALRLLAADASSAHTFESILRDKNEPTEIRQVSAAALHALRPERLQKHAKEILMDDSDDEHMHETSLMALTDFGTHDLGKDQGLLDRVNRMVGAKAPLPMKTSARRFLKKYGG